MTTMFILFSCFSCIWKHFREFASEYANIIMNKMKMAFWAEWSVEMKYKCVKETDTSYMYMPMFDVSI